MGCIARLGCLVLLVILGIGAWLTRDRVDGRVPSPAPAVVAAPVRWKPLTVGRAPGAATLDRLS